MYLKPKSAKIKAPEMKVENKMYKAPLFIAEISGNHLGSFSRAKQLVIAAADAGANAIKFQTYTADTMTLNLDKFKVSSEHELWGNRKLYELYQEAFTPWDWHPELFTLCRELGVIPFSSPFDLSAIHFLEKINCSMYKIASLETSDHLLIKTVAETGKPIIISTGATTWKEIVELVDVVKQTGNSNLTLLVCTSSYPANPIDSHISRIRTIREEFDVKVGLSDHTLGIGVSLAAIGVGATVIEKHLTLKRSDGGPDAAFSLEPNEFKNLVEEGNKAFSSLGNSEWSIQNSEKESRKLRRSLYITDDVKAGDKITVSNLRAIRPGEGCSPKFLQELLGRKFKKDFERGTPMDTSFATD
jgi:pseudaminic acid synthase